MLFLRTAYNVIICSRKVLTSQVLSHTHAHTYWQILTKCDIKKIAVAILAIPVAPPPVECVTDNTD